MTAGKVKVLIVAGGSGGHVLPAVNFESRLAQARQADVDTLLILCGKEDALRLYAGSARCQIQKLRRTFFGFMGLVLQSFEIVRRFNPDFIFGFGGFSTVPFLFWGKVLRRKTLIHEQNVFLGRANKFLSRFVDKIALTFSQSFEHLGSEKRKAFLCRYPLRRELVRLSKEEALGFFDLQKGLFTILVCGGSQGSEFLNELAIAAFAQRKDLDRLQVVHLSGSRDADRVAAAYKRAGIRSKVFAYLPQMQYAYSVADLVICRSGAGLVKEILFYGLPSVLVPYPLAGAHQEENARVLAQRGAAFLTQEEMLSSEFLNTLLDILTTDPLRLKMMASVAASLAAEDACINLEEFLFS